MTETTILIAEDERHTRNATSLILGNAGYKVFQTATGKEAAEMVERFRGTPTSTRLLIIDVGMSGPTGVQVLESARLRGDLTPAVVINRTHGNEAAGAPLGAGPSGSTPKPFELV
jgi:DNA-binding response OmpR family regulator